MRITNRSLVFAIAFLFVSTLFAQDAARDSQKSSGSIDVHIHLIPTTGGLFSKQDKSEGQKPGMGSGEKRVPNIGQGSHKGEKDYPAAGTTLLAAMDEMGVAKALLMPPPRIDENKNQGVGEQEGLFEVAKQNPTRIFVAGGGNDLNPIIHDIDPVAVTPEIRSKFEKVALELVKKGVRAFGEMAALHLSMQDEHVSEMAQPDHPLMLVLADIAAKHDMAIDLHTEAITKDMPCPENLPKKNPAILKANISGLEKLLSHNPKARIVWQHLGWDNTGERTVDLSRRLLKAHPNLFLAVRVEKRPMQIGGKTPMPNRIIDRDGKIKPEWMELFKEFPDRFVIGTDEFFNPNGGSPEPIESFRSTWKILDQLPDNLKKKFGGDNAKAIYRF